MSRIVTILAIGMALVASGAQAESATDRGMSPPSQYSSPGTGSGSSSAPGSMGATSSIGGQQDAVELRRHFMEARSSYNNRNFTASADHLRQASNLLRRQAASASGDVADNLRGTSKDLDELAENVQRGEERSFDNVNDKIGDAYKNMADFNYQKARESYERYRSSGQTTGRDVETGNALNAAAQNLEDWAAVTGRTLRSGTRTAVDTTRDLAGRMISGTGWAAEKTGEALDNFGNTIRDFGRDVRNRDESAPSGTSTGPGTTTSPDMTR